MTESASAPDSEQGVGAAVPLSPLHTNGFSLGVQAVDGNARATLLRTPRGDIATPVFMPVGTQATVKGLTPGELRSVGAQIVLCNTYHLWLRPGPDVVSQLGGLHRFMGWTGPILTDSGGFQVFSLAKLRTLDDDGVVFRSHVDGTRMTLTPEVAMEVQARLGSDIAMVLDECPPADANGAALDRAMARTTAWAKRSLAVDVNQITGDPTRAQARFGIVQGACDVKRRLAHLNEVSALDVDGVALGGLSVGEPPPEMYRVLQGVAPHMPRDRPRYLMGVGTPYDLLEAIGQGVDMFDCVLPTRNARTGQAWTWQGRVNLRQSRHRLDPLPLDEQCACPVCSTWSRGYLSHLFRVKEMLGPRLVTLHNLWFYRRLTVAAREAIVGGRFSEWSRQVVQGLRDGDEIGLAGSS